MLLSVAEALDKKPRLSECVRGTKMTLSYPLVALPSNIVAIESAMRFCDGTLEQVALYGPSGWGKTNLLVDVAKKLSESERSHVQVQSAYEWAGSGIRLESATPLVLDDVQDVMLHPKIRHKFKQKLNLRLRTNRRTLLSISTTENPQCARLPLPCSQSWTVAQICSPTQEERSAITQQIATQCGLKISNNVATLISKHLNGNGRSILGALQRLRLIKSDWTQPQDVMLICGTLSPYLLGENGWDPRDQVHEAVNRIGAGSGTTITKTGLCAYFMLVEMGLGESEVATFLRLSPGRVYKWAKEVQAELKSSDVEMLVSACRNAILSGFKEE